MTDSNLPNDVLAAITKYGGFRGLLNRLKELEENYEVVMEELQALRMSAIEAAKDTP